MECTSLWINQWETDRNGIKIRVQYTRNEKKSQSSLPFKIIKSNYPMIFPWFSPSISMAAMMQSMYPACSSFAAASGHRVRPERIRRQCSCFVPIICGFKMSCFLNMSWLETWLNPAYFPRQNGPQNINGFGWKVSNFESIHHGIAEHPFFRSPNVFPNTEPQTRVNPGPGSRGSRYRSAWPAK